MKSLLTIFKYIKNYPGLVAAYFTFNILSALFSVVSLGLLAPFLMLIFKQGDAFKAVTGAGWNPINYFKVYINEMIELPGGGARALLLICLVVFMAILLKNFFAYLS